MRTMRSVVNRCQELAEKAEQRGAGKGKCGVQHQKVVELSARISPTSATHKTTTHRAALSAYTKVLRERELQPLKGKDTLKHRNHVAPRRHTVRFPPCSIP
jgi:hypothetical protein